MAEPTDPIYRPTASRFRDYVKVDPNVVDVRPNEPPPPTTKVGMGEAIAGTTDPMAQVDPEGLVSLEEYERMMHAADHPGSPAAIAYEVERAGRTVKDHPDVLRDAITTGLGAIAPLAAEALLTRFGISALTLPSYTDARLFQLGKAATHGTMSKAETLSSATRAMTETYRQLGKMPGRIAARAGVSGAGTAAAGYGYDRLLGNQTSAGQAAVDFLVGATGETLQTGIAPALSLGGEALVKGMKKLPFANRVVAPFASSVNRDDAAAYYYLHTLGRKPGKMGLPTPGQLTPEGTPPHLAEGVSEIGIFSNPMMRANRREVEQMATDNVNSMVEKLAGPDYTFDPVSGARIDRPSFGSILKDRNQIARDTVRTQRDLLYGEVDELAGAAGEADDFVNFKGLKAVAGDLEARYGPHGPGLQSSVGGVKGVIEEILNKSNQMTEAEKVVLREGLGIAEDEAIPRVKVPFTRSFSDARTLLSGLKSLKRDAVSGVPFTNTQIGVISKLKGAAEADIDRALSELENGVDVRVALDNVDHWYAKTNEMFEQRLTETISKLATPAEIAEAARKADPDELEKIIKIIHTHDGNSASRARAANTIRRMQGEFLSDWIERSGVENPTGMGIADSATQTTRAYKDIDGTKLEREMDRWGGRGDRRVELLFPKQEERNSVRLGMRALAISQRSASKHFPGAVALQLVQAGAAGAMLGFGPDLGQGANYAPYALLTPIGIGLAMKNRAVSRWLTVGATSIPGTAAGIRAFAQYLLALKTEGILDNPEAVQVLEPAAIDQILRDANSTTPPLDSAQTGRSIKKPGSGVPGLFGSPNR
jgi:hypothetical protein